MGCFRSSGKPSRRDQQQYTSDISKSSDRQRGERKDPRRFTFHELQEAMEHFKPCKLLGEGGFGKVYAGKLPDTGQIVAIKVHSPDSRQGSKEFAAEVMTLSHADHPNLVKLIGYCAEGKNQKLLVYEFMPLGSLDQHLHDQTRPVLDWHTRMKIAAGAAEGLAYLHKTMNPHVIYRDMSSANVLLGEGYHSKLSDFGFARVGPVGESDCVFTTSLMGTSGYFAPEYAATGELTFELDIYGFGVLLLEILTGKKALDHTRRFDEHLLVDWVRHVWREEHDFKLMVDPKLEGQYPRRGFHLAMIIAYSCVSKNRKKRFTLTTIIRALNHLAYTV